MRCYNMQKSWKFGLAISYVGFILAACQGGEMTPTITVTEPHASPTLSASDRQEYLNTVGHVLDQIGLLTSLLSDVGLHLSLRPEDAPLTATAIRETYEEFQVTKSTISEARPALKYEEAHQLLLEALTLYSRAAEALLPDPDSLLADHARFQELMLQGGKNFHSAVASFPGLNSRR